MSNEYKDTLLDVATKLMAGMLSKPNRTYSCQELVKDSVMLAEMLIEKVAQICPEQTVKRPSWPWGSLAGKTSRDPNFGLPKTGDFIPSRFDELK